VSGAVQLVLTLLVGLATGILSGAFGIGGAVVSKPAIRALGVSPVDAVGTTLPAVIPSAVSGTLHYAREGFIRWRIVAWVGATGSIATIAGALLSHVVPGDGHLLMIVTAGLVGFTAWRLAMTPPAGEPVDAEDTPIAASLAVTTTAAEHAAVWKLVVAGIGAGGLSGLLGIGGGIVMVPSFSEWIGMSIKESVGTSLACVGILAVPGTIAHALLGDIDWSYAIPLCIAVIPGARIGAHLATRASDRSLRRAVGTGLGIVAVVYAAGELVSWLS
jgi:uncharacterized membrane protein YfcA